MANRRTDVYELQLFLRTIQIANGEQNLINPDGIYGNETSDAVMAFQIANSIPATGRVDRRTWDEIYRQYLIAEETLAPPRAIRIFPLWTEELKLGDELEEVYILQILLRKNDKRFNNQSSVPLNGIFDEETENAVKELQRIFNMPQTGRVDKPFWNRLADYHNAKYLNE